MANFVGAEIRERSRDVPTFRVVLIASFSKVLMSTLASSVEVQIRSVLIATDFSPASEKPLRHAAAIAQAYGAKFYLLHVVSTVGLTVVGPEAPSAPTEAAWINVHQLEDRLAESGALAGLFPEFLVRQGIVWEEVARVISEKHIDLLIIGTHGRRGLGKLVFGSVAEQIFRHADCPVLTVGPGSFKDPMIDNTGVVFPFLFGTDFGAASLRALPYAVSFANRVRTKLIVLHVIPRLSITLHRAGAHVARQAEEFARRSSLRRLEKLTENAELTVNPEFMVLFGSPSKKILEAAESFTADAIIMGLHQGSRLGTASHMLWATAYDVVLRAVCPVMTVRS
jgi:nucleotide-binding universal stress UspA family protein